jgi:thiamine pyrophosphate-dependent acetolactate synthase large subunit-like protein
MVHVYERVLQLLEAEGLKTMFGIPDPSFFHMFSTATARGWQVIAPHHEEAGAFMAEGMWRMTGKPAVIIGNQGPGVANLTSAAICARKENAPIIFIGGQRKARANQRVRRGRIQFTKQYKYFEESVKYCAIIEDPDQTDEIIREAFRQCYSGTPGPVYIEIPMNSMLAEIDVPPPVPPEAYRITRQEAGPEAIAKAVELIKAAKAPIVLSGHGVFASRALDKVGELVRKLDCAVIQTFPGSPVIPGMEERTFPCGFSPSSKEAVSGSDLVIAIGTEIGEPVWEGYRGHWAANDANRKWIHIERDPLSIGVNRPIHAPLVGDLRDVVPQLTAALKDVPVARNPKLDGWIKTHADWRADVATKVKPPSDPIHPSTFIYETTKAIPKDAVVCRDGGAVTIFTWTYSQLQSRDVVWNQNFGHLGTGLPYAIGAKLAVEKDRPVVLITGDSAFLFHTTELETAVRKNIPIVCVVGCDYAWGLEVRGYRGMIGPQSPETEAHWGKQLRLDKIAEGFGAYGEYVDRAEEIGPAIQRALASGRPAVIQVPIDGDANARDTPGHEEYATWYTDFF